MDKEEHVKKKAIENSMDRIRRYLCLKLESNRRSRVKVRAVGWTHAVAFQVFLPLLSGKELLYVSMARHGSGDRIKSNVSSGTAEQAAFVYLTQGCIPQESFKN